MTQSFAKLRSVHAAEERKLVLAALKAHDWRVGTAAKALGIAPSTLQRLVEVHGLQEQYARHSPGRGRPRKS